MIKECKDPDIAAVRSAIRIESNEFYNNWEKAVEHILPCCPVSAKKNKKKGGPNPAEVSTAETIKKGVGKTGVELRWYKRASSKTSPRCRKMSLLNITEIITSLILMEKVVEILITMARIIGNRTKGDLSRNCHKEV